MSPRPILKHHHDLQQQQQRQHHPPESSDHPLFIPSPFPFAACSTVLLSPHVHFPPTPSLTSTFTTHSPTSYDRTPLVVAPNNCALPGRHEREFTEGRRWRSSGGGRGRGEEVKGSYFHPRAYEACCSPELSLPAPAPASAPPSSSSSSSSPSTSVSMLSSYASRPSPSRPPPLIPDSSYYDVSSESDDSDGLITTPPDPTTSRVFPVVCFSPSSPTSSLGAGGMLPRGGDGHPMMMSPYSHTQEQIESALAVLAQTSASTDALTQTRIRTPPPLKERRKVKRTHTGHTVRERPRGNGGESNGKDERNFSAPLLDFDGCLGGF